MAKKATTLDVRFIVDVQPDKYGDRLAFSAYPVVITEEGKIRNCSWSSMQDEGAEYADLKIEASADAHDTGFYYGYDPVAYREVFSANGQRVEVMVKTLRRLNKSLKVQEEQNGRPVDLADFLGRLARAAGSQTIDPFGVKVSGRGWTYDDNEYHWQGVNELRWWLQKKLTDWKGGS